MFLAKMVQAQDGRNVSNICTCSCHAKSPRSSSYTPRCSKFMAFSRQRELICFYCNKRSGLKKDGVRKFECRSCMAVNYLDSNGEITDPPVATDTEALSQIQYARPSSPAVLDDYPKPSESTGLFCQTCERNQNLYTATIAQYDPEYMEYDPSRPLSPDRKFLEFKKRALEKYPQVCKDCQLGVDARIRKANRMAGADNLRYRLDKTRGLRSTATTNSWLDFFSWLGMTLYWGGITLQLLFNIKSLLEIARVWVAPMCVDALELSDPDAPSVEQLPMDMKCWLYALSATLPGVGTSTGYGLPSLAVTGLSMSILSFCWNPYFRNIIRGFDRHINGFMDWYKFQTILLVARIAFFIATKDQDLVHMNIEASIGGHLFILVFTLMMTVVSRSSITVDYKKLFPDSRHARQPHVMESVEASTYDGNTMASALDNILSETTPKHVPFASQTLSRASFRTEMQPQPVSRKYSLSPPQVSSSGISLALMNDEEAASYLQRGEIPLRMQQIDHGDEMEWTPSQSSVKEFNPQPRRLVLQSHNSPQPTAVAEQPFWAKVPPAPVSQAHRLRNPPNQPYLQPNSQERKDSFFNDMTGRAPSFNTANSNNIEPRREMILQPPKFFPSTGPDITSSLSDFMEKSFSLKSEDDDNTVGSVAREQHAPGLHASQSHLMSIFVIIICFGGWNLAINREDLPTLSITLGIMTVCLAIAIRTVTDLTLSDKAKDNMGLTSAIMICLAGMEAAAAGLVALNIIMTREVSKDYQFNGSLVLSVMLVQEVWFCLF